MKAKTHLSQAKSRGGFTLVEMLVVIGMIAALAGISFPVYRGIQKKVEKQKVLMMFTAIDNAVENFETEYTYLPYVGSAYPAVEPNFTFQNTSAFTTVLAGGYSAANAANFKAIQFFEWEEPEGNAPNNYKNGLLITGQGAAKTATLYTPWGGEYDHFTLDYDMDGQTWLPFAGGVKAPSVKIVFLLDWGPDSAWAPTNPATDEFCSCQRCIVCERLW